MKKHTYIVEVQTGSDFQDQCMTEAIEMYLSCLHNFFIEKHRSNKITFTKK